MRGFPRTEVGTAETVAWSLLLMVTGRGTGYDFRTGYIRTEQNTSKYPSDAGIVSTFGTTSVPRLIDWFTSHLVRSVCSFICVFARFVCLFVCFVVLLLVQNFDVDEYVKRMGYDPVRDADKV